MFPSSHMLPLCSELSPCGPKGTTKSHLHIFFPTPPQKTDVTICTGAISLLQITHRWDIVYTVLGKPIDLLQWMTLRQVSKQSLSHTFSILGTSFCLLAKVRAPLKLNIQFRIQLNWTTSSMMTMQVNEPSIKRKAKQEKPSEFPRSIQL